MLYIKTGANLPWDFERFRALFKEKALIWTWWSFVILKGYLRYKTIFCHKVALDV